MLLHTASGEEGSLLPSITSNGGGIEYAVGDAGIGIRRSLAEEYPEITDDVSAIIKAREYGATRFGQDQRGAGLSETVDQVASWVAESLSAAALGW